MIDPLVDALGASVDEHMLKRAVSGIVMPLMKRPEDKQDEEEGEEDEDEEVTLRTRRTQHCERAPVATPACTTPPSISAL